MAQASRPTVQALANYLGVNVPEADSSGEPSQIEDAYETALSEVEAQVNWQKVADTGEGSDADEVTDGATADEAALYPWGVRRAVLSYGAQLFKRRLAPEGVAQFDGLGPIATPSGLPGDVEQLLGRYLKIDGFA